jgi:Chaperone of endosialidase
MNASIQLKPTTSSLFIAFVLLCLRFLPAAQAVVPPPDGGYPNFTTAEGQNALFSLTTGAANTAVGWRSLFSNATGSFNTATGAGALFSNTTGNHNTASGGAALYFNTTGSDNTANGYLALVSNTIGNGNTAMGHAALFGNTEGIDNVATGSHALAANTTGSFNTAVGNQTLQNSTSGSFNIALRGGFNLTTGNFNIDIGSDGVAGESATIRIGDGCCQSQAFIAGIFGTAVSGSTVVVNANGQLGVAPSSTRFKDDIKPMDKASEAILALKPVSFRYKKEIDPQGIPQFGVVAEEVEKVNPDLIVRDQEGKPHTVRYEQINAMLLNEFLKARRQIDAQQKQIEALTAGLQKVSAQFESSKPALQKVLNSR